MPVDVGVVLHKPCVSQDDCLMANAQDIELGLALMTLVLDNEIDGFSVPISFGDPSALYNLFGHGS